MSEVNKIAKITLLFWLMKIIATTLGETLGDLLSMTLDLGYTLSLGITAAGFLLVLGIQLSLKKYEPISFWLVIIATTTLGTEISDYIDRTLNLGYTGGSILLCFALAITLFLWYRKYKNLEVYPIFSGQKELYFWLAVLISNSLGTAFGDYLSDVAGFSYLQGALVTSGIIILLLAVHYASKINEVFLFWMAFIFTRPFGATFGDFLTKPIAKGGLDLGTLQASLVSLFLILALMAYAHFQHHKSEVIPK